MHIIIYSSLLFVVIFTLSLLYFYAYFKHSYKEKVQQYFNDLSNSVMLVIADRAFFAFLNSGKVTRQHILLNNPFLNFSGFLAFEKKLASMRSEYHLTAFIFKNPRTKKIEYHHGTALPFQIYFKIKTMFYTADTGIID